MEEEYRVHHRDGRLYYQSDRYPLPYEKKARRLAQAAVGHAVELWQADRFIERFEPEGCHSRGPG
jgi:hypothetical protein